MQQAVPQQQSKANSGISPNDPFFAAFQSKPATQNPTQAAAVGPVAKANDPFAELMASTTQTSSSTPEKVSVNNGPSNPFGAPATQNSANPFGGVQNGSWGAPQPAGPQPGGFGMQQGYGYPPQTQQAYGYPPQTQQQYGYPNQQQQQFRSPQQQQQMMGYPPQ